MSDDFQLFPGKDLSGLFKDIYDNQVNKKKRISEVIAEMRNMVRHAGDFAVIGPIIKDLIETSVKNDEQLVKLATIAQRILISRQKNEGEEGFLSKEEREQLLKEIDEVEDEIVLEEEVMSDDDINEVKEKLEENDVS